MASNLLGRVNCPINCGHNAAAVKLKTDKGEGKTAYPYVHCAGCGTQLHTRSETQARHLLAMTRPEKGAEAPPKAGMVPPSDERPPVDSKPPATEKKPSGWLLGGFGGGAQ